MLFNSMQIMGRLNGGRGGGAAPDTNAALANLMSPIPQADGTSYTPTMVARTAGYSAELLDRFLGKLGKPIGVAAYKPVNSVGEEYLPNFLGMIGVPVDLVPEFPTNAPAVLLTEASAYDKDLVAKVKKFVQGGGRVIATTSLIEALGEKGFQDLAEIQVTGHRVIAKNFGGGRGGFGGRGAGGGAAATPEPDLNIVMPQMRHFENDTWMAIPFNTADYSYPMAISASYGKGTFYALAIPDDFADLYRLPQSVLTQIRNLLGREVFASLEAPDHVSLFVYDNHTFIVQNFHDQAVDARVSVVNATSLHDLLTDETVASQGGGRGGGRGGFGGFGGGGARGAFGGNNGTTFAINVPGHSFRVFAVEK